MSTAFGRTDRSMLGNWWWTIDRPILVTLLLLVITGFIVVFAASPAVAIAKMQGDAYHFVVRHGAFTLVGLPCLFVCSLMKPVGVLRLARALLVIGVAAMILASIFGPEINGAHRWLRVAGVQLQPSEFVKPALAVVTAWLLTRGPLLPQGTQVCVLVIGVTGILAMQPDMGMAVVVASVAVIQLFVAGLPWLLVGLLGGLGVGAGWLAYKFVSHVADRIDAFLEPPEKYSQLGEALRAIFSGGLFGKGPGEGEVKLTLPDAHTDFIFATTAEEFGIITCFLILCMFAFLFLRSLRRIEDTDDTFVRLTVVGLASQIGLQALINMAVNLNLVPTKGMTLPFISYGGSSLIALAIGTGFLLALTRRGARLEHTP